VAVAVIAVIVGGRGYDTRPAPKPIREMAKRNKRMTRFAASTVVVRIRWRCVLFRLRCGLSRSALAASSGLRAEHIDIINAFCQADIDGVDIWIQPPRGFEHLCKYGQGLKLIKALYGTKHAFDGRATRGGAAERIPAVAPRTVVGGGNPPTFPRVY